VLTRSRNKRIAAPRGRYGACSMVQQRICIMRTEAPTQHTAAKKRFDITTVMRRLRRAAKPYEPAAMFVLADEGYGSVFQILVACIISIRTFEEVTLPTARKLFAVAKTPARVAKLSVSEIDELIRACTFHEPKARMIHEIAVRAVKELDAPDDLPGEMDVLLSFRGVGPKCAKLVMGIAAGAPQGVPVDIHVHRVTNRWGYVCGSTPEQTMVELENKLPRRYWMEINKLLVPFGKHICAGKAPKCSTCPLLECCRQVGVTTHR
jgi:endonuclease-3